jgi:serine protease Do
MTLKGLFARPFPLILWLALAAVGGGLVATSVAHWSPAKVFGSTKVPLKIAANMDPLSLGVFKNGFASAVDPALPAVVNISTTTVVKRQYSAPDFFNDPLFRQFFGDQFGAPSAGPETEREHALGSGVIVNPNGYILTNNHVVSGATDIQVFTNDQRKFTAKVVGTDPRTDIAVLKIAAGGLPALTLGHSADLKVGDLVFAIGDPLGVGETATAGIVSATGRGLGGAIERYEDFIQTDAPINPGNSGGALIEAHGNLIGINTAILSGSGGNEGIGFAIPIDMARNVMEQILDHGKVIRGYLGVMIQPVGPDMAKAFGLSRGGGALVADVSPGSPAAKGALERGDVILELNGEAVRGPDDLSVRISQTAPGTPVTLKIFRNGQTRDLTLTLGENSEQESASAGSGAGAATTLQGLQVQNLTPDLARQFGLSPATQGVVVTSVDPSSAAAAVDLERGDVIVEVNHQAVHNANQFNQAISASGKQAILLLVNRGGRTHFVVVTPQ